MSNFLLLLLLATKIVAPDTTQVGQPTMFTTDSTAISAIWRVTPQEEGDVLLTLYDANQKPVIIYWTLVPGPKQIEHITGTCAGDDTHTVSIDIESKGLEVTGTGPGPDPEPDPDPEPLPTPIPTPEYRAKVAPLVAYVSGVQVADADAAVISEFYFDFASVVAASQLKTNTQFREAYIEAGKLALPELKGKYSGLGATIDRIIMSDLGNTPATLNKVETASLLRAIGWAVLQ